MQPLKEQITTYLEVLELKFKDIMAVVYGSEFGNLDETSEQEEVI